MCWSSYEERLREEEERREEELRLLEAEAEKRAEELLSAKEREPETVRA